MSSSNARGKKLLADASNSRKVPANASNSRKVLANASNRQQVPANASNRRSSAVDPLPAAFRLSFGPVTSDLVSIDLKDISFPDVKSFNIWCSEENEEIFSKGPVSSFLCDRPKRVSVSKLRPGTKYTFRAVAYGEKGEVGWSQAMCSTKPVDTNHENSNPPGPTNLERGKNIQEGSCSNAVVGQYQEGNCPNAGVVQIQEGGCSSAGVERGCGGAEEAVREMHSPPTTYGRSHLPDLNEDAGLVPDLNGNGGPAPDLNEYGGAVPNLNEDNDRAEVLPTADANSDLVDRPPPGGFEGNLGHCVKVIGRLERNGHLGTDFGMKFLTWLTQRASTEQKRTVGLFIGALGDDEERLAKQLVDTYSQKINKRLKH